MSFELFIILFVAAGGIIHLLRMLWYGGSRGALFGASVHHHVGGVTGRARGPNHTSTITLRVHRVKTRDSRPGLGLEWRGTSRGVLNYWHSVHGVRLTSAQARRFKSLLQSAIERYESDHSGCR